jgi:hypothetical protein
MDAFERFENGGEHVDAVPGPQLEALLIALSALEICVELCRKLQADRTADELVALRKDIVQVLREPESAAH